MTTTEWVIDWFKSHSSESEETIRQSMTANYMELGLIDSFGFVQMLSDIDDEFDVMFVNEDFLNPNFQNIEGLIKLIDERK